MLEQLLALLTAYRYLLLLPLAVVEGPVIAVLAGWLCHSGFMQPLPAYLTIVAGDILGDALMYQLGKKSLKGKIPLVAYWLGVRPARMEKMAGVFAAHPGKMITLSKLTLGIGVIGIFFAGHQQLPFRRFIGLCLLVSLTQYIFYLGLGISFGYAYRQINEYLNEFAAITLLAGSGIFIFFILKRITKRA